MAISEKLVTAFLGIRFMPSDIKLTISRPNNLIVYIQYTNPAGYPPLEHSSRILADAGWKVLFLGAPAKGADRLEFPKHRNITVRRLTSFGDGFAQKIHYSCYIFWCLFVCAFERPNWIYASEPMAALPALIIQRFCRMRVLYHEHDSPSYRRNLTIFQKLLVKSRMKIAVIADLVVLPQRQRLEAFIASTGRSGPSFCVWNCSRMEEVVKQRSAIPLGKPLRFYYHGSVNSKRLPLSILDALAKGSATAELIVVGYETIGSIGYLNQFVSHAVDLGIGHRLVIQGVLMKRSEILNQAASCDVGFSFMPMTFNDINMDHMVGASNKPFDYLAAGLMLLVSDLPDWKSMYVEPGYGLACDPTSKDGLANLISWCEANREEVRARGEAGRQRVLSDWNYEHHFAVVLKTLQGLSA